MAKLVGDMVTSVDCGTLQIEVLSTNLIAFRAGVWRIQMTAFDLGIYNSGTCKHLNRLIKNDSMV